MKLLAWEQEVNLEWDNRKFVKNLNLQKLYNKILFLKTKPPKIQLIFENFGLVIFLKTFV